MCGVLSRTAYTQLCAVQDKCIRLLFGHGVLTSLQWQTLQSHAAVLKKLGAEQE